MTEIFSSYLINVFFFLIVSNILLFLILILREFFLQYKKENDLKNKSFSEQQQVIIDVFNESLDSKKIKNILGRFNRVIFAASVFFITYKLYNIPKAIVATVIFYILMLLSYRLSDSTDKMSEKWFKKKKK